MCAYTNDKVNIARSYELSNKHRFNIISQALNGMPFVFPVTFSHQEVKPMIKRKVPGIVDELKPLKFNIEPENDGFQKGSGLFQGAIFRFHVKLRGCSPF